MNGLHGHYSQMHGVSDTKSDYVQPGGHKKYRTLAATHPVAIHYFNLDDAKVLLFFDMSKFFGKKMQEMVVFWKISAKIGKFRSKNPVFGYIKKHPSSGCYRLVYLSYVGRM